MGLSVLAALALARLAGAGELVLNRGDLSLAVGQRSTLAVTNAQGEARGSIRWALVDRRTVGDTELYHEVLALESFSIDLWVSVSDHELAIYSSLAARVPARRFPFPLKAGMSYEYQAETAKVKARVEGPVDVTVPAGKYTCLVIAEERSAAGKTWTEKWWLAPEVGTVKLREEKKETVDISLAKVEEPRVPKPPPGARVVSTFDTGEPLRSTLFPAAVWRGGSGKRECASHVDVDAFTGANGTPFSLRWSYHVAGTWASASILPSGNPRTPVDLSRYGTLSFYVKALHARGCALTLRAKKAGEDQAILVHVPVQVTPQWKKVVINLRDQPQLEGIDLKEVYLLALGVFSEEPSGNVVWLDEVMLHPAEGLGEF